MIEPAHIYLLYALIVCIIIFGLLNYFEHKRKIETLEVILKSTRSRMEEKIEYIWELKRDHQKLVSALGYELEHPGITKYVKKETK